MSSVLPNRRRIVFAAACLAGLTAGAAAAAETAAPGQVIGYANADRSGASQAWDLPPDKPYLYVPAIPASLGGRIAAIETGPEVGVALFRDPYFSSRDRGCQPALGSTGRPYLAWLGATARFAPAPPGQGDPAGDPAGEDDGYGSLIVYRADLGPPPGTLLMDRRVTLGVRCTNPIHKTIYHRIFVPVAAAPETVRCFDLAGDYPGASGPVPLDFVKSDRVVLLMPGDMDDRYARIRHDVTVTLFEGLSCSGRSLTLDSRSQLRRDVRLSQMDFRDRARSLRLSYDYGNADAFLVRRPTPAPAPAARAALAAPSQSQAPATPALAAEPIQDPAIGRAESPPAMAPSPASAAAPAIGPSATADAPGEKPVPAPTETPVEVRAETPVEAPMESPAKAPVKAPAKAPVKAPVAASAPAPATAPTARTIPKLSPVMKSPSTQTAALPTAAKTFAFPVHDVYRLNHCLRWQSDCGQPAAEAWCRAQGYAQALDWSIDENIGSIFPTIVLGDLRVCAQFVCDGFKEITCGP